MAPHSSRAAAPPLFDHRWTRRAFRVVTAPVIGYLAVGGGLLRAPSASGRSPR